MGVGTTLSLKKIGNHRYLLCRAANTGVAAYKHVNYVTQCRNCEVGLCLLKSRLSLPCQILFPLKAGMSKHIYI